MTKLLLRGIRGNQTPKMTQRRMAMRIAAVLGRSFSEARYWQIENGAGAEPSHDERKAIAAVLRCKVSDISWPVVEQSIAS